MKATHRIDRRLFLKGVGTALALPALESILPGSLLAAEKTARAKAPTRMAFIYHPNGVIRDAWQTPTGPIGAELPRTLQPLANFRDKFQLLSGLDHKKAYGNGDGAGDHARANATFLTGAQAKKTSGTDINLGKSVDQYAADVIGIETPLPSLELSTSNARSSGRCDSGYSCAYQYNLSWRTDSMPMPPEKNPRIVFERLFSSSELSEQADQRERRIKLRKSVLDFVMDDAKAMHSRMSGRDREKVDEYLTSVREVERRVELAEKANAARGDFNAPNGIPEAYSMHIKTMFDLMAIAFETDSTRVSTFMLSHDGSNRPFREIDVAMGHHSLSHHGGDAEKIEMIRKIDRFYVEQFAHFLGRLSTTVEADGSTLLDNSMILYGSGINDGNRHNHSNLPVILAGGGGGRLHPGVHRDMGGQPMTNLYMSMLDMVGAAPEAPIGDATGFVGAV